MAGNFAGKRIVVIGTSGSGKTTLARRLADKLGIPHVEVDALYWGPNWTESTAEELRARVETALAGECWVVDGNYSRVRQFIWDQADTIVWLDYPLPVIMNRLIRRTTRRIVSQEELWAGNRETFRKTFLSKDSILLWALTSYRKNRLRYPPMFLEPQNAHLEVLHFKSPHATENWLNSL